MQAQSLFAGAKVKSLDAGLALLKKSLDTQVEPDRVHEILEEFTDIVAEATDEYTAAGKRTMFREMAFPEDVWAKIHLGHTLDLFYEFVDELGEYYQLEECPHFIAALYEAIPDDMDTWIYNGLKDMGLPKKWLKQHYA